MMSPNIRPEGNIISNEYLEGTGNLWSYPNEDLPATPPADDYVNEDATSSLHLAPIKLNAEPMVAVIGVGYVGLQLIACFSSEFQVLGFDISKERIGFVQEQFRHNGGVRCTNDASELKDATHFLIAVPTLLLPDKRIDSSALREAIKTVAMYARPGATVVVESSVAVGMTRQLLGPVAASRGLFAGMSPEVSSLFLGKNAMSGG
jgi:hypothetical protein